MAKLDLSIDEFRLHEEWGLYPATYCDFARKLAAASSQVDAAKSEMELTKAEIGTSIRSDPSLFGLEKITEGVVSETIVQQPEYRAAVKRLNQAKEKHDLLQAAVRALDQKGRALSKMTDLWIREYYSDVGAQKLQKEGAGTDELRSRIGRRLNKEDDGGYDDNE